MKTARNRLLRYILITICLVYMTVSISVAQETGGELYERAILLKEGEGDLDGALALFKRIVDEFSSNRPLSAKALFQIGVCQEKLGRQEAERSFRKIVDEYPEQTEVVGLARERLAALQIAAREIESGKIDQVLQQVWARPLDNMGAPSPDGRYLSFCNWDKAGLAIYEISTGKIQELPSTNGSWEGSMRWAESSIWSPDGKQLAYVWYDNRKDENGEGRPIAIRIANIDGSEPRELFSDKKVNYPHPCYWSNDGKYVVVYLHDPSKHQIGLVSVEDCSVNIMKEFGWLHATRVSLSPDNQYLVYDLNENEDSLERDIYLLDTETKEETVLIKHPATDYAPFWSQDGKKIIFFSDRSGSVGVWTQKFSDGKVVGQPRLAKNLSRALPMGITRDDHLFLCTLEGGTNIYSVAIDPDSGKLISTPQRIVETNIGWNLGACYSPDGNYVAYVSLRGILPREIVWGQENLIIRDLRSGEERVLIPKLTVIAEGPGAQPQWSADGQKILINGRDMTGARGQYVVSVSNATVKPLFGDRADQRPGLVTWSKDGKKLFYRYYGTTDKDGVYVEERSTGQTTKLYDEKDVGTLALHPDGNLLALATNETIELLAIDSGDTQELFKLRGSPRTVMAWSPDGRRLYFRKWNDEKKVSELWHVTSDGTDAEFLGISFPQIGSISVHPAGTQLAFTVRKEEDLFSIWKMMNFIEDD